MIDKRDFLKAIEVIREQDAFYTGLSMVCAKYDVDYSFADSGMTGRVIDTMLDILMHGMNDEDGLMVWWVYDCGFGEDHATITVSEDGEEGETKTRYDLDTPEKLYDYLVKFYD